jgi:hypothetical protein
MTGHSDVAAAPTLRAMLTLSARNDDHARAAICLQLLDLQLLRPLGVTILCPPSELAEVTARFAEGPRPWRRITVQVLDETPLLGSDIADDTSVRGTVRQMLLKLGFAELCETTHYLTLDADVALVQPLDPTMLFRDGRALLEHKLNVLDSEWYKVAARLLGTPMSYTAGMNVTPALLACGGVCDVIAALAERHGDWRRALAKAHAAGQRWTEYALYYHHLASTGALGDLHFSAPGSALHARRSVWRPQQIEQWTLAAAQGGPGWFTVLQSSSGLTVGQVREMLAPLLGPAPATPPG